MKVQIRVLRGLPTLRAKLSRDGWVLKSESDGCIAACHREVSTSTQARERLHRLGLLISPDLSIEFTLVEPKQRSGRREL